jgi:predicted transcriptional regulator
MVYLAQNRGFLHNGNVKVTLTLDDDLVKKVRKIAAERDTTLTGMVRDYLEKTAAVEAASGRKRRERAALERSFETIQVHIGKPTWNRADLHVRS